MTSPGSAAVSGSHPDLESSRASAAYYRGDGARVLDLDGPFC